MLLLRVHHQYGIMQSVRVTSYRIDHYPVSREEFANGRKDKEAGESTCQEGEDHLQTRVPLKRTLSC